MMDVTHHIISYRIIPYVRTSNEQVISQTVHTISHACVCVWFFLTWTISSLSPRLSTVSIMPEQFHFHITTLPDDHITTLPCIHNTILSYEHNSTLPDDHMTIGPYYHMATFPYDHITTIPYYHMNTIPHYHVTILPHYHITILPKYKWKASGVYWIYIYTYAYGTI